MGLLSNLKYGTDINGEKDSVGGNFSPLESNIYLATVKYAYIKPAKSGALGLHMGFDIAGKEYSEILWISNKEGKNYYTAQDGSKAYLPSFNHADNIALFTCQKPLSELDTDKKVIKLYDFTQSKEVPTEVDMIVDMLGKEVQLGIIKEIKPKQVKTASGDYVNVDTGETKEVNQINKVFHPKNNKTVAEVKAKADEASFYTEWLNKWEGVTKDSTGGKSTPKTNTSNTASQPSSLFA